MNLMKLKGEIKMGALSEQELAAFSADFNKNDKNKKFNLYLSWYRRG